jgi:hypothetical protein
MDPPAPAAHSRPPPHWAALWPTIPTAAFPPLHVPLNSSNGILPSAAVGTQSIQNSRSVPNAPPHPWPLGAPHSSSRMAMGPAPPPSSWPSLSGKLKYGEIKPTKRIKTKRTIFGIEIIM